jgi:hypothetical protein
MKPATKLTVGVLLLTGLVLALMMNACAAAPCERAEQVMAKRGLVLECHKRREWDTGDAVDVCTVRAKGRTREMTVFPAHCRE